MDMTALMYVAIGGAVGSMCRYLTTIAVSQHSTAEFPYATFIINIVGSFLMGMWIAGMAGMMPSKAKDLHLLFAVGVLGGFTTFSTFSLEAFVLIQRGLLGQAGMYIVGSVVLSIIALIFGMWCLKFLSA